MSKVQGKTRTCKATRAVFGGARLEMEPRVNRERLFVSSLTARADDVQYWRSRSTGARLAYMEYLRLINYGQAATSRRLKRVLEITQLRPR